MIVLRPRVHVTVFPILITDFVKIIFWIVCFSMFLTSFFEIIFKIFFFKIRIFLKINFKFISLKKNKVACFTSYVFIHHLLFHQQVKTSKRRQGAPELPYNRRASSCQHSSSGYYRIEVSISSFGFLTVKLPLPAAIPLAVLNKGG